MNNSRKCLFLISPLIIFCCNNMFASFPGAGSGNEIVNDSYGEIAKKCVETWCKIIQNKNDSPRFDWNANNIPQELPAEKAKRVAFERELVDILNQQLLSAVKDNNVAKVKYLIAIGANINFKDTGGWTILMHAADQNNYEIVKLLLTQGVNFMETISFERLEASSDTKYIDVFTAVNMSSNKQIVALLHAAEVNWVSQHKRK